MCLYDHCCCHHCVRNRGLESEQTVLLTHGDSVDDVADGFQVIARSAHSIAGVSVLMLFLF